MDVRATRREVDLLRALRRHLPFAIPDPTHVAPDLRYYAYPVLRGRAADTRPSVTLPTDAFITAWVRCRCAIAGALTIDGAKSLGVRELSAQSNVDLARNLAQRHGTPEALAALIHEDIRRIEERWSREPAEFTHNDLNLQNLLLDAEGASIVGVLDFGDAHIAPRSSDYYLWDKWPEPVMDRVAEAAAREGDPFDPAFARALHRVYVASDIVAAERDADRERESTLWAELWRCCGP